MKEESRNRRGSWNLVRERYRDGEKERIMASPRLILRLSNFLENGTGYIEGT